MTCSGCANNWVRVKEGERLGYCVLDGRSSYGVTECNLYFTGVVNVVVEKKEEELGKVVDLGYGAVVEEEEKVMEKKKRGRPWGSRKG